MAKARTEIHGQFAELFLKLTFTTNSQKFIHNKFTKSEGCFNYQLTECDWARLQLLIVVNAERKKARQLRIG